MSDRALVKNAADPAQVKYARRKERDRQERFTSALKASLQHPEVRLVFAELLERAGLYTTSFDHSGSVMNFKEGARNFGLQMFAWLEDADEQLADLMEQERRARRRQENRAVDAAHIARAEEQTT